MTTTHPKFTFQQYLDGYKVYVGEALIGNVRKFERGYNLRRYIVIRGWRATLPSGEKLYSADSGTSADTRIGAARVLYKEFTK